MILVSFWMFLLHKFRKVFIPDVHLRWCYQFCPVVSVSCEWNIGLGPQNHAPLLPCRHAPNRRRGRVHVRRSLESSHSKRPWFLYKNKKKQKEIRLSAEGNLENKIRIISRSANRTPSRHRQRKIVHLKPVSFSRVGCTGSLDVKHSKTWSRRDAQLWRPLEPNMARFPLPQAT